MNIYRICSLFLLGLLLVLLTGCDTGQGLLRLQAGTDFAEARLAEGEQVVAELESAAGTAEQVLAQGEQLAEQYGIEAAQRLIEQAQATLAEVRPRLAEARASLPVLRQAAASWRTELEQAQELHASGGSDLQVWGSLGVSALLGVLNLLQAYQARRSQRAVELSSDHGDRIERLAVAAHPELSSALSAEKAHSKAQQLAAGLHQLIQRQRGKRG